MGMDFVVVLYPSVDEPKRCLGFRYCRDANVILLQGFDEGFGHAWP